MKVAIIGHGGHGKMVHEVLKSYPEHRFVAFLDDKYSNVIEQDDFICAPLHHVQNLIAHFYDIRFINGIGDNEYRKRVFDQLDLPNEFYISLIHPKAVVSSSARIGDGSVIMPNAVINVGAEVNDHVIVNTGAILEHDSKVGSFAHISPNATLLGNVKVDKGTHIGSGATILPNLAIGEWSKIGAGATIIHDIPPFSTAVGVPGRILDKKTNMESQKGMAHGY